jgi:hypothetical protein
LKRLILLAAAGLLGLSACTKYGYVKPGVSDAEYAQDSQDCADIAQHQAFRDYSIFETRSRFRNSFDDRRRFSTFDPLALSPGELEFRYRRLCMISRGYELAPLEDEGEAEADGDE